MASTWTDDQLTDFKEAFSLFDRSGNGQVSVDVIGDLLRALGHNPTMAELRTVVATLPDTSVTFDGFLQLLQNPDVAATRAAPSAQQIDTFVQGLQVFDKDGNGFMTVGELRYVLTNLGEKLTDKEVDELLKSVEVGKDGYINYEDFVKHVISN